MANVLLITSGSNMGHAAPTNSKAALESQGHTVTLGSDSPINEVSLVGVDVIATVRATRDFVSDWLAARWAEGYPILVGGPENGAVDGETVHTGQDLGILTFPMTSSPTQGASYWLTSIADHAITTGFTPGSDVNILPMDNFSVVDTSTPHGVALGSKGSPNPGAYFIAVESGETIASSVAPARAVFCGWLYAGQSDYTTDGKVLLGQAVDWLATEPTPSAIFHWDGTALQPASVVGWWDGSAFQPATVVGWWDGAAIQDIGFAR